MSQDLMTWLMGSVVLSLGIKDAARAPRVEKKSH
jgi:hypothetical protein